VSKPEASATSAAPLKGAAAKKTAAKKAATKKAGTHKAKVAKTSQAAGTKKRSVVRKVGVVTGTGRSLVIVESPAKARTIKKYLGSRFTVKASVGHIKDLPKSKIGVSIQDDFEPHYEVISGKTKVIGEIKKAAGEVDTVFLAPDPDREGEAIAWHIAEEIRPVNGNIQRVLFNEITKRGVTEALEHPTSIDSNKFESQQARRILDRLVGYQISPILWTKVKRGLSAGRVQSVAVRLLVDRDREIAAFVPEEFWSVEVEAQAKTPPPFGLKLTQLDGKKADLKDGEVAKLAAKTLSRVTAQVSWVERKERKRNPLPPFITSKLQQEAARKLRFTAKRTMGLAQRLYEGVDLTDDGPVGLITYMRTDSVRLSDDALADCRAHIQERYGAAYLPDAPNVYKSNSRAQGAHEAIRPTSLRYTPEAVKRLMVVKDDPREADDLWRLYTLIWNRFVACQMRPALYDQTTVDVAYQRYGLRATGQVLKFPGYTKVYTESWEEGGEAAPEDAGANEDRPLPPLNKGDSVRLGEARAEQHFTQSPPRFTEASLVKELEERGIGRPSTYASILSTIQDRGYAEKREGRFFPTELGSLVNDLLVESFPNILDVDFTAQMEDRLDQVEEGNVNWVELLRGFYGPFEGDLEKAKAQMRDIKRQEIPTEHTCEKCGKPMVIKWGRNGSFLACSGYPDCKNTKQILKQTDGKVEVAPETTTDEKCTNCGSPMWVKRGRFGEFLACSAYPECKQTRPISLGVNCPKPDCGGFLAAKRSKRGKTFYGCSNYSKTKCDFVAWDKPVAQPCPQCHAPLLVKRENRKGTLLKCLTEGCGYTQGSAGADEGDGEVDKGAA
jgi:DNA topoisomerase-1